MGGSYRPPDVPRGDVVAVLCDRDFVDKNGGLRWDVAKPVTYGDHLSGAREIDAEGLYVLPGAIAAAFGGVTTMIDQAQVEAGTSLEDGVDSRLEEAAGSSLIDYSLHGR